MKKFLFVVVAMLGFATPALADGRCGPNAVAAGYYSNQCIQTSSGSSYGNNSGSQWVTPGSRYGSGYNDYGYVDPRYYNQTQIGRTKREKDPSNRFQFCDGIGWVKFGQACNAQGTSRPTTYAPTTPSNGSQWVMRVTPSDGCTYQGDVDANGRKLYQCPM